MKTVSFFGSVPAGQSASFVSPIIRSKYKVKKIRVSFALGCDNLVVLRFYKSMDDYAPSDGLPTGINLLAEYGQVNYITGNNEQVILEHEVEQDTGNSFLKVCAGNADSVAHSVNVQIMIEPI
jgi:hypothetical protein